MINIFQKTDKEVLKSMVLVRVGRHKFIHAGRVWVEHLFGDSENTNENPLKMFILFKLPITLPGVYFRKYMDRYAKTCSKMLIIMSKEKTTAEVDYIIL